MVTQAPRVWSTCGIALSADGPRAAAEHVTALALERAGGDVHLCNAYTLSLASSDPSLQALLADASLNLVDGTPLAWLGRRSVEGLAAVRGPDLFREVVQLGRERGLTHVLYGATEPVLEELQRRLAELAPGARVLGALAPPFAPVEDLVTGDITGLVQATDPHVVWVGLGTPKQDHVAHALSQRHPRTMFIAVGAAFDFTAGTTAEAPAWLRGTGLEWLHRFAAEPGRLWRRYTVHNLRFARAVVESEVSERRARRRRA